MSKSDFENIKGEIIPRCNTCGCQDCFEYNDDYSYIKCTNCGRVYFRGKGELLEYNQEVIDEAIDLLVSGKKVAYDEELQQLITEE